MSTSWQWAKANPDAAARRIRELERENAALRAELAREAELNGAGSEREARLMAKVAELEQDKARLELEAQQ